MPTHFDIPYESGSCYRVTTSEVTLGIHREDGYQSDAPDWSGLFPLLLIGTPRLLVRDSPNYM